MEMNNMANSTGASGMGDGVISQYAVGTQVRVFWPVDNNWYIGTVQQYNPATGEHLLKYEDGDTEWVQIGGSNTIVPIGEGAGEFDGSTSFDPDFGDGNDAISHRAVGTQVNVFRPVHNSWYIGIVQQCNPATGEHLLKYEDGDTQWVQIFGESNNLVLESNTTVNPSDFNTQLNNATTTLKIITHEYGDFAISAYDYDIVRNLFVTYGQVSDEDVEELFRENIGRGFGEEDSVDVNLFVGERLGMRLDDEDRRVVAITLEWVVNIDPILEQLKRLPHLTKLVLKEPEFECLSSCIRDFHNLKALAIHGELYGHGRFERLPKEIGNLRNLEELRLVRTSVKALPEEIGKLTNLTRLVLSKTKLKALPVEIGNLRNLKELILKDTKLKALPEEIGNLTNLTRLVLYNTKRLTSLPSSMPPNLEELILCGVEGLKELPSDIGTLPSLTTLELKGSGVQSLPDYSKSLPRLHYLILDDTIAENPEFSVEALVQTYPSLVSFGYCDLHDEELNLALACRRARISIRRGLAASRMPHPTAPKAALWPYMLQYSAAPFNQYPPTETQETRYSDNNGGYEMQGHDAIYQLLSNHQIVPRARIGLGWEALPKLWPYVLQQSTVPFNHYHPLEPHPECYKRRYDVQEQDAVYLLLSIHRGSFLGVLNCGDSSE